VYFATCRRGICLQFDIRGATRGYTRAATMQAGTA